MQHGTSTVNSVTRQRMRRPLLLPALVFVSLIASACTQTVAGHASGHAQSTSTAPTASASSAPVAAATSSGPANPPCQLTIDEFALHVPPGMTLSTPANEAPLLPGVEECYWLKKTADPLVFTSLKIDLANISQSSKTPEEGLAEAKSAVCVEPSEATPGPISTSFVCGHSAYKVETWDGGMVVGSTYALVEFALGGDPTTWPGDKVIYNVQGDLIKYL